MANSSDELHPASSPDKGQSKKRGLKWFFIDLWWVHLIAIIVITLCVTLPIVYVAYPKISQDDVNKSTLNLSSMSITKPSPKGFHLKLDSELTNHAIFHPNLMPWNATIYLNGGNMSLFTLPIPALHGKTGAVAAVDQYVALADSQIDPFTEYVRTMVVNDTLTTRLIGRGPLKLGALPTTHVNYNKTLSMGGFAGLKTITITNPTLLTTPQPDNATLSALVTIPNPSGATVELGNLTFGLSLPASVMGTDLPTPLGYATVNNTILIPGGTNTFTLRSVANQTLVVQAVAKNATLLKTGLPLTVVTRKVEYDGAEIPWLTQALASQELSQTLNISQVLSGGK